MTALSPPLISRYHVDILSLQPHDKATMLGVSKKELVSRTILHENRGYFPEKRNAFVLDDQDGHCDVTCKPEL